MAGRLAPAPYADPNVGQGSSYNLNTIPMSAIERIDILKDGASAIYGSDAMAGVINIVLRRDFTRRGGHVFVLDQARQLGRLPGATNLRRESASGTWLATSTTSSSPRISTSARASAAGIRQRDCQRRHAPHRRPS
jgi:outer membrane receptor protein involved in Fe transport